MATLGNPVSVKRFELPTTANLPQEQRAWADLETGQLMVADVLAVHQDMTRNQASMVMLAQRIKSWNYMEKVGEKEQMVPITYENIGKLDVTDFFYLVEQVESAVEAVDGTLPKVPSDN